MMVEPGLDVLLPQVDSKYTLVSVSSKCARKIMARDGGSLDNPVTRALQQIADGKVEWERFEGDPDEFLKAQDEAAAAEEGEAENAAEDAEDGADGEESPETTEETEEANG